MTIGELSGRVLEPLWDDGEFVLYRSAPSADASPLLVVAPAQATATAVVLARLEHVCALRDELDPAWAARPVGLVHQPGRPLLVLEDPGGDLLARFVGVPWEVPPFLRVAIGQLAVSLVPEVELLIGQQPPVPELSPQDAQSRFYMAIRRFVGVFARREHPLALFLDDLQWLDPATLDLLEHLVTHPEVRHVLFVGAYRSNEVARSAGGGHAPGVRLAGKTFASCRTSSSARSSSARRTRSPSMRAGCRGSPPTSGHRRSRSPPSWSRTSDR